MIFALIMKKKELFYTVIKIPFQTLSALSNIFNTVIQDPLRGILVSCLLAPTPTSFFSEIFASLCPQSTLREDIALLRPLTQWFVPLYIDPHKVSQFADNFCLIAFEMESWTHFELTLIKHSMIPADVSVAHQIFLSGCWQCDKIMFFFAFLRTRNIKKTHKLYKLGTQKAFFRKYYRKNFAKGAKFARFCQRTAKQQQHHHLGQRFMCHGIDNGVQT